MPLYEYRCTQCGNVFDKIQSFKSKPERECPTCKGPLERPLSAPAFQFKGAGWYVNDYSGSKPSGSSSGSTPATESKPASTEPAAASAASTPASASTPEAS